MSAAARRVFTVYQHTVKSGPTSTFTFEKDENFLPKISKISFGTDSWMKLKVKVTIKKLAKNCIILSSI